MGVACGAAPVLIGIAHITRMVNLSMLILKVIPSVCRGGLRDNLLKPTAWRSFQVQRMLRAAGLHVGGVWCPGCTDTQ